MATVRMSQKLIDNMVSNASRKFEKQNPKKEFPATAGDKIVDEFKLIDKCLSTKKHVEETWGSMAKVPTSTVSSVCIKSELSEHDDSGEYRSSYERRKSYVLDLSTPLEVPEILDPRYGSFDLNVGHTNEIFIQCYAIDQENTRITERQYEFKNDLRNTLRQFTTLNQALKASDGAYGKLVPQESMTRVMEKDDRTRRAAELAEIAQKDISTLQEVLLTDSLLGDD